MTAVRATPRADQVRGASSAGPGPPMLLMPALCADTTAMTPNDSRRAGAARRAPRSAGFTLLEVMVAVVISAIGLLGTVAVQQTMFNATANAGDSAVATRLATRAMEEMQAKIVTAGPPVVDQLAPSLTAGWSTAVYMNALGVANPAGVQTTDYRFRRQVQVVNLGPTQPYNVSVRIIYANDSGTSKTVRLDMQRYKTW